MLNSTIREEGSAAAVNEDVNRFARVRWLKAKTYAKMRETWRRVFLFVDILVDEYPRGGGGRLWAYLHGRAGYLSCLSMEDSD